MRIGCLVSLSMISGHPTFTAAQTPSVSATSPTRARKAGFALLITITLLAFLVLLLVSLASLTRVETQVATNNQQLNQARQNALMALNIAVGQLQKYTGPDQRTTARADMNVAWANATNVNGRWVGAYGNGATIDTTYSLKPSQIPATLTGANADTKGSQAKLINWLVSGNEGVTFNPATSVGADGHISTAPTSFPFKPDSTINLTTASASPALAATQTLLVGANSVIAPSDYVTAPLVSITVPESSVPGLDPTSNTPATVGRYAWWVGDEGIKARVNLPMATAAQAPQAFVSAQRAAIEWVDKVNPVGSTASFDAADLIGPSAYDPTDENLPQIVSAGQLPLLTPGSATTLSTASRLRFHDLTGHATSVLADNYAGGLKKDLSAVLAKNASVPADTDFLFTPDNDTTTDSFGVPNWGMLRSFAQTTATVNAAGDLDPIKPILSTPTSVGISPVLTYVSMGLQYAAPEGVADGKPIRVAVFPLVVLWNPHTTALKARHYEVGMIRRFFAGYQLQMITPNPAFNPALPEDPVTNPRYIGDWTAKESIDFSRAGARWGTGTAGTYLRFVVDAPDIPPGASLIFTLQNDESGEDYNAPLDGKPKNVLRPGLNDLGHVLLNHGATFGTGESTKIFRVSGAHMLSPITTQAFGMSGGEICAYLGDETDAGTSGTKSFFRDDGSDNHQWHQFVRVFPAFDGPPNRAGSRNSLLQSEGPLGVVFKPTSVMTIKKLFGDPTPEPNYPEVRWIAQCNPRASIVSIIPRTKNQGLSALNYSGYGGMQGKWDDFIPDGSFLRTSAGTSLDDSATVDATLFEFRPSTQPLLSLGQLQHANLSIYDAGYPAYAVGNSLADFHFVDNTRDQVRKAYTMTPGTDNAPSTQMTSYYDLSWLLNRALWDRYFVSTVPHDGTAAVTIPIPPPTFPLPNPRHVRVGTSDEADLLDANKAAANLVLAGGFNINSTSEQAWRAVLGGVNRLSYNPENPTDLPSQLQAALPRFSRPTEPVAPADIAASAPWQGYRQLTDEQIAQLAKNIVEEVRNRGPFVSLADFVNRRLKDNADTATSDERTRGVIQAAIDATVTGSAATNSQVAPFNDTPAYTGYAITKGIYDVELMRGNEAASIAPYSSTSAFAPQFLTQADVLSTIGSGLSARSDTFTIRTYGEVISPVTQDIQGRAWCEAVVQRLPDYINPSDNAPEDAPATLTADNKAFGRQYKIISFRWLSPNDI